MSQNLAPQSPLPPKSFNLDELKQMYRTMLRVRRFEERFGQLYGMGLIGGFGNLCIGQEAVYGALAHVKESTDKVIGSYRNHGLAIACHTNLNALMAEMLGREDGLMGGKGGAAHICDPKNGLYGGEAIVGAQTLHAVGLAFAARYKGEGGVTFCFLGDGVANRADFFNSLNLTQARQLQLAQDKKLPVIFVIENNRYAMATAVTRHAAGVAEGRDLYKRGESRGVPGIETDGQDVIHSTTALLEARQYTEQHGPIIVEMHTYRFRGHSMNDAAKYRPAGELDHIRNNRDPLENLRKVLVSKKGGTEFLKFIEEETRAAINQASEKAQRSPEPSIHKLVQDVVVPVRPIRAARVRIGQVKSHERRP